MFYPDCMVGEWHVWENTWLFSWDFGEAKKDCNCINHKDLFSRMISRDLVGKEIYSLSGILLGKVLNLVWFSYSRWVKDLSVVLCLPTHGSSAASRALIWSQGVLICVSWVYGTDLSVGMDCWETEYSSPGKHWRLLPFQTWNESKYQIS